MASSNELASAIRFLSVDAVELAQSGHPGMPLGMADIATVLWTKFLKHNPKNPAWFNRDRFVLSNGHGSMLLYALLHLTGYDLTIEDLKQFRQLHSKTPGHPERLETPGVETTTGPLGQGLANAVGMAVAEKQLAARFNRDDISIVDHFTYAFVGDGCLMEGVSHEACSLAGTLGLGRLIVFYDANGISIDGEIDAWFTDNTAERFRAYDWHVIETIDGHDDVAIEQAIEMARNETNKPSLIICKTVIGYGSEAAGSGAVHGAPLGADDIVQLRRRLNWPHPPFVIPKALYEAWSSVEAGVRLEETWLKQCYAYESRCPEAYCELLRVLNGDLPDTWCETSDAFIEQCRVEQKAVATRKASQQCLNHYAPYLPELLGGSADLTGSNNTNWSGSQALSKIVWDGNYLHYGVREFGMSAMMNGMALHGGVIPYGGTFLVFSDYARAALRLAALMKIRVVFVYTHDSVGLGEDGPTHQPIEQIATLRMMPGLDVWRPADLMETAVAWQQVLLHAAGPSCILLSRQTLPALTHSKAEADGMKRGGYVLRETQGTPDVILLATGSEVQLALKAADELAESMVKVRVVSMPCVEQFLRQSSAYQEMVLPKVVSRRVAIEAAASGSWYRFTGREGVVIGLDEFGISAPLGDVFEVFGLTVKRVVEAVQVFFSEKCES
ncbi:MAG: transketolase [Gammaproteobacteria bacterium]|nr:transketolase [Gammaproteobacteria bacterium]